MNKIKRSISFLLAFVLLFSLGFTQNFNVTNIVKASQDNILLGDFNKNDTVDTADINTFIQNYGKGYSISYDIAPAVKGSDKWSDIYSVTTPDDKVNILDYMVLSKNNGKTKPEDIKPVSISITGPTEVKEKEEISLIATVKYSDGKEAVETVTWSSSSEANATVDANGKVTGVKEGTTNITAQKGTITSAPFAIKVSKTVKSGITIYVEKPTSWSEIWMWFETDPSTKPWDTTALKTPPGDMTEYRTGWYEKNLPTATSVEFLFNDGTWVNKLNGNGLNDIKETGNFTTTKSIWITKDGKTHESDPLGLQVSATPGTSDFSETVTVTLKVTGANITVSKYTLDGSDPATNGIDFTNGKTVTIGEGMAVGQSKTLKLYATDGTDSATKEFVYTKTDLPPPPPITDNVNNLRLYQIMVSSFQDGDPNVGYGTGYGPGPHNGDLRGIINALPYIKSTGANAIWLTPIFESGSVSGPLASTGYFADNYFKVDPKFGSDADFRELVKKTHEAGMYIILDGVFGHHGKSDVPPSPKGNRVTNSRPQGEGFETKFPDSLNYFKEVATYWIEEYEIDGWRLDQAYQLATGPHDGKTFQDRNYWKDIRETVEATSAKRKAEGKKWGTLGYMVGEIWDGSGDSIQKNGYDAQGQIGLRSNFEFPLRYKMVQTLAVEESGKGKYGAETLAAGYDVMKKYSSHAVPNLFITNHDVIRFGELISRGYGYGKENPDYWKRHKAIFSFMAAFTGPLTIYYGDEIGDDIPGYNKGGDNGWYDDNASRTKGQTSGLDSNQQNLKDYVASLMTMREQNPALWNGSRTNLMASGNKYADLKVDGSNKVVYVLNTGTSKDTISVSQGTAGGSQLVDLLTNETISASGGNYNIPVEGLSGRFLKVQ